MIDILVDLASGLIDLAGDSLPEALSFLAATGAVILTVKYLSMQQFKQEIKVEALKHGLVGEGLKAEVKSIEQKGHVYNLSTLVTDVNGNTHSCIVAAESIEPKLMTVIDNHSTINV